MKLISAKQRPHIAKVGSSTFAKLDIKAASWVHLTDQTNNYYCCLWPALIPEDTVLYDNTIHFTSDNNTECSIIPIHPKIAIRVTITLEKKNDTFKSDTIRNALLHTVVKSGVTVSSTIKVLSTLPDTPVIITPATRIIYQEQQQEEAIDQLETQLKQITISDRLTGLEKAYNQLYEVVSYPFLYKNWIERLGIECPKGVLLYGPPGVGKTYLVSMVASACNAKMFIIQGPEIFGPYLGESEERLRSKFMEARTYAEQHDEPVILFMDEIDALTPKRDNAQSHENRVVAQLLTLMDGIHSRGKLIVVGATNRPNAIDPALRRPGRFDREIAIDAPDANTRLSLFESQLKSMPIHQDVDKKALAGATNGYVAADIKSVCREAAMMAVKRVIQGQKDDVSVTMSDFRSAFALVGPSMQRGFQVHTEPVGWDDVGGLQDVKKQLKQAVEWPLLYKDSFTRLGLKPPRGILLYGPPGCSKTTLVKVIASSANVAFLSINGAQIYSPFVGDSEKIVRTTFQKARASAPSIIFLDETEAIVGKRNMGNGGSSGDSVQERVLSTLLNEMDGVEGADSVLVVGATNRPDMLDAALLRPGRFDRLVYVPPPDELARLEILKIHTKSMPLSQDVDLESVAARTELYTGADLQNICREAAMVALRKTQSTQQVTMEDFNQSLNTIPASISPEALVAYSKKPQGESS